MAIRQFLNLRRYRSYKWLFDQPEGKQVLADMCRAHGVFECEFSADPYENAFACGERNAVLRILTILSLTPKEVAELTKED